MPHVFDKAIILLQISCFKYIFNYFNVYKLDGSLAQNLDEFFEMV